MQRQFTSGSRQAPDPFDQFLEENNFYRKHTARDSSCLFRVISEQMYDTQLHHLIIRKKCVRYMRKHSEFFQPLVDRDLDEYLDDLSKPKTYGTLVELQAVGFVFQRNIILFQPFDLGNYFGNNHQSMEVFRVFYTPERHFDSVFTCDYIKDAAICQSICYEILYKDLYKLPDVCFAVEQMLHSASFDDPGCRSECNEDGYCTRINLSDGRSFELDLPHDTSCILENYKLCHFHYTNFPRMSDELQRDIKVYNNLGDGPDTKDILNKTAESLLPNKFISCVRQLLQEGITPFPYKVAKALDPNMYRNIEFDSWNEARKELKLQNWYKGDTNFKVGAKCHVKLRKSENDLYTCHIQEIAMDKGYCIVFIEQLGEKRLVPYESLMPLPPEQFKPWTLPYRLQRHMQKYSSFRYTRHYNYHFKCNGQVAQHEYCTSSVPNMKSEYYDVMTSDEEKHPYATSAQHHSNCYYKLKQYTHLENFRAQTLEYCTMPLTVEHGSGNRDSDTKAQRSTETSSRAPSRSSALTTDGPQLKQEIEDTPPTAINTNGVLQAEQYELEGGSYMQEVPCFYPVHQYGGSAEEYYGYGYDGSVPALMPPGAAGTIYYATYPPPPPQGNLYMPTAPTHGQPSHPVFAAVSSATSGGHVGGYFPSTYYSAAMVPSSSLIASSSHLNTPITTHNLTPSTRVGRGISTIAGNVSLTGRVNWDAKKSVKANGMDLPADASTLRYFYNLGLDYHNKYLKHQHTSGVGCGGAEDTGIDAKEQMVKISSELQNIKLDENGNLQETKCDANNNNNNGNNPISTTNHSGNSGTSKPNPSSHQRRFPSRYFNSKERQAYQQRSGGNMASGHQNRGNNSAMGSQQHQHQQEHSKNHLGGKGNSSSNVANSRNQVQTSNTGSYGNVCNVSSNNSLRTVTEQGIQTSPLLAYNGANIAAENNQTPPTLYNPNFNPFITCGPYDYIGDQNGPVPPPTHFAPPPPGGLLIPMPMAPSGYSIYTAPPPPALGLHPTAGAYASYVGLAPPTAATGAQAVPIPSPLHGPQPPPPHTPMTSAIQPPLPPPTPQHSQTAPQSQTNGFYTAGILTTSGPEAVLDNNGVTVGAADGSGMHFQCMSYPPPMPIFYSPTNAATAAGAGANLNTPNGGQIQQQQLQPLTAPVVGVGGGGGGVVAGPPSTSVCQQTYWCVPPPPNTQTISGNNNTSGSENPTPATTTTTGGSGGSAGHHRRDKPSPNE